MAPDEEVSVLLDAMMLHSKNDLFLLGPSVHRHQCWRRRKRKYKEKWKVKRSQWHRNKFLNSLQSGQIAWNQCCHVDRGFLLAPASPFLLHPSHGCVPEEVLGEFVCDHGCAFLAAPWLMDCFNTLSLEDGTQKTVARLNLCQVSLEMDHSAPWKRQMFKS